MILTLDQWQRTIKPVNDLIVQASNKDAEDTWNSWPIGMSWRYVECYKGDPILQLGNHNKLVMSAISASTDTRRRPSGLNRYLILDTLSKNGIHNNTIHHLEYFTSLSSYKFVISPEGNGIDCHRHYEALLAGCIPVVEKNNLTEDKYKGCPILWTTDYSEITPEYLEKKYKEMQFITYDFSCLFLSNHDKDTQALIKDAGNYWLKNVKETSWCVWYK